MSYLDRYAREDTHYLLHIYDVMRNELLASSRNTDDDLVEVFFFDYSNSLFGHGDIMGIHIRNR